MQLKKSTHLQRINTFVYGTLMRGHLGGRTFNPGLLDRSRGRVNGRLHHLGDYPWIATEHDGIVHGEASSLRVILNQVLTSWTASRGG